MKLRKLTPLCLQMTLMPLLANAVETINVLVCLVQWKNHDKRALVPKNQIEQLWNGPSNSNIVPGESISDYIESNTYGKYRIQADVVDWVKVSETEEYASNGNMGNAANGRSLEDIMVPILANSGVNLAKYADENNNLKGVAFVHSGYAAENGGSDCETGATYTNRIKSSSWSADVTVGSVRFANFATMSAFTGICNEKRNSIGIWVHEWLHSRFGLEDLYDIGGRYNDSKVAPGGIGAFGVMSYEGGTDHKGTYPGILSPYHKMKLDALEPIEITTNGTFTARASALYPDVYIIKGPYADREHLLIENRQPLLSDKNLWEPGGIVIYHIDENLRGNDKRGGPFVEGWPGNGYHYKVAVLQADGKYELEQAINLGDSGDFWNKGDVLGPGNGEINATACGTYPNTDSYVGGNIVVTGLVIDNFSETDSGVWSFTVSNLQMTQPTSVSPTRSPTVGSVPQQTELEPIRCPQYTLSFYADAGFMCDCNEDCEGHSYLCDCDEGKACCEAFTLLSGAPTTNGSKPPTETPVSTVAPSLAPCIGQEPTETTLANPVASSEPEEESSHATFLIVLLILVILAGGGYVAYLEKKSKDGPQHNNYETSDEENNFEDE